MQTVKNILTLVITMSFFTACQQPSGNTTGSEYMPDMGHSVAYEANYYTYYVHNTWGTEDEYYKMASPRTPVSGTIPRGATDASLKGAVVYDYADTEEERTRAMAEIINNPYPITDAGLARGKDLYNVVCGICHGEKGDGMGYLVREDGGKYPAAPANFLLADNVSASNGKYYHAIMYGKNVMGTYKDKISYEERWQVIHYIRSLQAKSLKLEYSQMSNTLNSVDIPAGKNMHIAHKVEVEHKAEH